MKNYKHALSLTSQIPFCSVPLRLDAYDKCQFSCTYCFAKARGGSRGTEGVTAANPDAIRKRFERVARGEYASALDEMLGARVPIQFGGMTDPFSPVENHAQKTLALLKVLADFDYPTLISTKGLAPREVKYLNILRRGNFYVRISITGAAHAISSKLERNVASVKSRLLMVEALSHAGIPTSVRLQPLIPGCEENAASIIEGASAHGAKHVSVEYLKWPVEKESHQNILLRRLLPTLEGTYNKGNSTRVGREYVLNSGYKVANLLELEGVARSNGILFGFADNDLLHLNEFVSCCNGGDAFLRNATFFQTNILTAIKRGLPSGEIRFDAIRSEWMPKHSINNYLNSRSRPAVPDETYGEWLGYLREKWNGPSIRGGPSAFWGCVSTSRNDLEGNAIFTVSPELRHVLSARSKAPIGFSVPPLPPSVTVAALPHTDNSRKVMEGVV